MVWAAGESRLIKLSPLQCPFSVSSCLSDRVLNVSKFHPGTELHLSFYYFLHVLLFNLEILRLLICANFLFTQKLSCMNVLRIKSQSDWEWDTGADYILTKVHWDKTLWFLKQQRWGSFLCALLLFWDSFWFIFVWFSHFLLGVDCWHSQWMTDSFSMSNIVF